MQQSAPHDDLYSLLGIHPAAPLDAITLAYRKCARTWHPDRNPAADAADTFKRIRHAYEVLRDPARRADYDRSVPKRPRRRPAEAAPARAAPAAQPASDGTLDLGRRARITLHEQLSGCDCTLKVTRTEYCRRCGGSGHAAGAPAPCATCKGAGEQRTSSGFFPFFRFETHACADCEGAGTVRPPCKTCAGRGIDARKSGLLRFAIPAGIRPDSTLRVRGHGRRARDGAACGDLLVRVGIAPHPLFTPAFPDLRCEMPVSVFRVMADQRLAVPTLDVPVLVPLPAAAADGTELRIPGHGMLDAATGTRGDLRVTLRVTRPQTLSARERALLAELDQLAATAPAHLDWVRRQREAQRLQRTTADEPA